MWPGYSRYFVCRVMKVILAEKIKMSQVFDKKGNVIPVTLVQVKDNIVIRAKTKEKDGYEALQVGYGARKAKNVAKAQKGEWKELGTFKKVKEFRGSAEGKNKGDKIDVSIFQEGDYVKVSGISKAKGFQGVVKRHGFHGAPASHGTKHALRSPGSIGATWPQRVIKGMRMAGRMGGVRISTKNLQVVKIDPEENILAIKGAVPGKRGTLLEIRG